jgi:hypothetical protein
LGILGFLWGWSERLKFERAVATSTEQFYQAISGALGRDMAKGTVSGAAFIIFTFGSGFLLSFKPWDTEATITSNFIDVGGGLLGGYWWG